MLCKKCGAQIPDNSVFCPDCGAKAAVEARQNEESAVDKITQSEESATNETTQNEQPIQDSLIPQELLSEHEQDQAKEQPKKKKNKKLMIGISVAAILLIFGVAIFAHVASKGSKAEAANNNQTTTEQTEKDTETETASTNEYGHETYSDDVAEARLAELDENANLDNLTISQQIENFNAIAEDLTDDQLVNYLEIKSDGYLSEDELGNLFVDRMNKWINAGAYDDMGDLSVDETGTWDEYLPKVAEKNSQFYTEALIDSTSEYSDSESLNDFTAFMTKINRGVLGDYVSTAWSSKDHPENVQPYSDWLELQDAELVNGGGESNYIEIKLTTVEDSNGGIENNSPASSNPEITWYIKAVRSDDGVYKLVSVVYSVG